MQVGGGSSGRCLAVGSGHLPPHRSPHPAGTHAALLPHPALGLHGRLQVSHTEGTRHCRGDDLIGQEEEDEATETSAEIHGTATALQLQY